MKARHVGMILAVLAVSGSHRLFGRFLMPGEEGGGYGMGRVPATARAAGSAARAVAAT
ncbi:MAG: hypothetical protein MZV70_09005 [Desulfobacterales bacterium]|nr:hypothetical protein [Desulfobacterales bacterium]